jgi:molybdenum cofactor cytidylyltransferase
MDSVVHNCGVVVLAAGQSARLGRPKQLLQFEGKTLLEAVVEKAVTIAVGPIAVVVGAALGEVMERLKQMPVDIIHNPDWKEGMGSSLSNGVSEILIKNPNLDGLMVLVCDQPLLTTEHLIQLLKQQQKTGMAAVASSYQNRLGTPAVFHKSFFEELKCLKGDEGARKLIAGKMNLVAALPFEDGAFDIDTNEDYERLMNLKKETHDPRLI